MTSFVSAQKRDDTRVVALTADAALLDVELRSLADIEAIERVPLERRLTVVNFSERIGLALAMRNPEDPAILYVPDGDIDTAAEPTSFAELRRNIDRTARLLRARGIQRDDVVAILLPAVPSIYWSILGTMACGIPFPINWMLEPKHVLHLLQQANAKAIIALGPTPGFKIWESLMSIRGDLPTQLPIWSVEGPGGEILPESDLDAKIARQPDEPDRLNAISGDHTAAYVHSGGTTGFPKIVRLSHRNMSFRHWTLQLASKYVLGETVFHDAPMFHVGGLAGRCLPPLASGASVLIPSIWGARDKRFIANYWKFVEKYRVTRLSGVPTTLAVLAKSPPQGEDLSSLKPYFITGSTALPGAVRKDFERISGVRVLNSYGMTENTASIAVDPRDGFSKEGSSGVRLPYTQVRTAIVDDRGRVARVCEPGEIGMLLVKGPGLTPGYVNSAHDGTSRTEDGWLITGDLGRIDRDGYLFITGRAKDVIIRGGHNIDPSLIEEPLLRFPEVLHAAAVGKPDAYAGELPVVFAQLTPGSSATPSDLFAFLAERITEKAAMPKDVFIVDQLPLTDVGKPKKAALRQEAAERTFQTALADAAGALGHDAQINVRVRPDPTFGTLVKIVVAGAAHPQQEILTFRIRQTMNQYSFAYTVEWVQDREARQV
jgi:fatty-acyl-CoA synthase